MIWSIVVYFVLGLCFCFCIIFVIFFLKVTYFALTSSISCLLRYMRCIYFLQWQKMKNFIVLWLCTWASLTCSQMMYSADKFLPFFYIIKFSWATSHVRWLNGEKKQHFKNHLRPRPQGTDVAGVPIHVIYMSAWAPFSWLRASQ
jgi:hypothetical protein